MASGRVCKPAALDMQAARRIFGDDAGADTCICSHFLVRERQRLVSDAILHYIYGSASGFV